MSQVVGVAVAHWGPCDVHWEVAHKEVVVEVISSCEPHCDTRDWTESWHETRDTC